MTHPSERMSEEQISRITSALDRHPPIDLTSNETLMGAQAITQLRTALAAANERAERAEKSKDTCIKLARRAQEERDTLRTQLAEAVEALIELEDIGIASMTLLEGSHLHKKMDIAVDNARVVISANSGTISRLTRDAAASPKNPDDSGSPDADASGEEF